MILQWDESFDIGSDTLTGVKADHRRGRRRPITRAGGGPASAGAGLRDDSVGRAGAGPPPTCNAIVGRWVRGWERPHHDQGAGCGLYVVRPAVLHRRGVARGADRTCIDHAGLRPGQGRAAGRTYDQTVADGGSTSTSCVQSSLALTEGAPQTISNLNDPRVSFAAEPHPDSLSGLGFSVRAWASARR